jgi:hypothetical protein
MVVMGESESSWDSLLRFGIPESSGSVFWAFNAFTGRILLGTFRSPSVGFEEFPK